MANIIKIKRGFTAGTEPTGLTLGELAANLGDGKLFIGGPTGNIIQLLSGGGGVATNIPIASSSVTGVASFNINDFVVSSTGHVGLTSQIVRSVNSTSPDANGNVVISGLPSTVNLPLATSSITGVASFNSSYFTVSGVGAVSLASGYQVTGDTVVAGTNVSISRAGNTVTVSSSGGGSSPPVATSSITGVASFGNEFVVSALGAVSLTGNYVKSFNGATGVVSYSPRLATTSLTGEASFNSTYFSVDGLGAVSLASGYQVTGDTVVAGPRTSVTRSGNTVTIGDAVPVATSSVTGVAMFTNDFAVSSLGSVSLTGNLVTSFNGATGAVTYSPRIATTSLTGESSFNSTYFTVDGFGAVSLASGYQVTGDTVVAGPRTSVVRSGNTVTIGDAVPVASSSVTGVASFNASDFSVSALGDVTLSNVARTNSTNTFTGLQTFNAGLTTQSLFVSQGATFNSASTFLGAASIAGSLTAQSLFVSQGATFNNRASFVSGLTTQSLFVAQGATFNGRSTFTSGLTTQSLFVAQGATFNSSASFLGGLTTQGIFVSQGATFAGNVQINGNLTVGDSVSDIVTMASGQVIKTYTATTTSVTQTTIAMQASLSYSCADVIVQAERKDGTDATVGVQTVRIMIVSNQNGALSTHTQYANVSTGSSVSTITVDDDGLNWRVRATPASTDSTLFRVYAILYPTYGTGGA